MNILALNLQTLHARAAAETRREQDSLASRARNLALIRQTVVQRSGLGDRLGRCDGLDFWSVILNWSDDQVAEVERWLVNSTAEMPEVLRG